MKEYIACNIFEVRHVHALGQRPKVRGRRQNATTQNAVITLPIAEEISF